MERVGGIAQTLAHLASLRVSHDAREIDVAKRNEFFIRMPRFSPKVRHVAHEFHVRHDHPRDPEENDVRRGDERVRRIEKAQFFGACRPAERGHGPQPRGEPSVEHILVLADRRLGRKFEFCARFLLVACRGICPIWTIIHGDPVSPPQLTRNAPVADVVHPMLVDFHPSLGMELDRSVLHHAQGRLGKRLHAHKPLVREIRLDDRMAPVTLADVDRVLLRLDDQPLLIEGFDDRLARIEPVLSLEFAGRMVVHAAGFSHHIDVGKVVALAEQEVVRVVCGRDLHESRSERHVDVVVGDDRQAAPHEW